METWLMREYANNNVMTEKLCLRGILLKMLYSESNYVTMNFFENQELRVETNSMNSHENWKYKLDQ